MESFEEVNYKINTLYSDYVSNVSLDNTLISYTEMSKFKELEKEVAKCVRKTVTDAQVDHL